MPEGHIIVLEAMKGLGMRPPLNAGDAKVVSVLAVFEDRGASSSGRALVIHASAASGSLDGKYIEKVYCY